MVILLSLGLWGTALAATSALERPLGYLGKPADYNQTIKRFDYPPSKLRFPSYFNWADLGMVTPAKDQGYCGSCWAFCVVGVLESKILIAGGSSYDISEEQQVACDTDNFGCCGGYLDTLRFWETHSPMQESCTGYPDYTTSCPTYTTVSCSNLESSCSTLPYHTTGFYTVDASSIDQIKSTVTIDGPACLGFRVHYDFFTYWAYASPGAVYTNTVNDLRGGHMVPIIGWDDEKGAWLCKNSWGATDGPNGDGTFWIAYTGHANDLDFGVANSQLTTIVPAQCDHTEEIIAHTFLGTGTGQDWNSDDNSWPYTLPFTFPFFGQTYTSVNVSSNGFVDFVTPSGDFTPSEAELINNVRIAPLWADLDTRPGDIYIHQPTPDSVCIRWEGCEWGYSSSSINVELILYQDGRIQFNYGSGNSMYRTPLIGISGGDGVHYCLSTYNGNTVLTDADSVLYTPGTPPPPEEAEWTFMVYLDGDNNLEQFGIADFLEMASVGSSSAINILVQFDRIGEYDSSYDDWTTCKRYRLTPGMTPTAANALQDLGEVDMGDLGTLRDFIDWGIANYPASQYALILWNHGGGWRERELALKASLKAARTERERAKIKKMLLKLEEEKKAHPAYKAVCWDDTDGGVLYTQELREALDAASGDMNLLGFDACLMSMIEVAYEVKDTGVSVMVGSEETEPGTGWPYDTILSDLAGNPAWDASALGISIVDRYYESYGNDMTMAAIDIAHLDSLAGLVSSLADTMMASWATDQQAVKDAAQLVKDEIDQTVIDEHHGSSWPGAHGLAIYFPQYEGDFDPDYNGSNINFAADTLWEEFLADFYASMSGSWIALARSGAQEFYYPQHIDLYDFCENLVSWTEPECGHTEAILPHTFLGNGTGQGWNADDMSWSYTLPFAFPFYGVSYTTVNVCSNGFLDFASSSADYTNSTEELISNVRIAPLWTDIVTTGDIYIHQPSADSVCIRWEGVEYTDGGSINVEVILYADGRIKFNYGSGNTSIAGWTGSPTIGISAGDGSHYCLSIHNGNTELTDADSILYTPGIPPSPVATDIFWYKSGHAPDSLWVANGDGTFTNVAQQIYLTYNPPFTGDFNGDGLTDIFWYRPGNDSDYIYFANGDGTFSPPPVEDLFIDGTYQPLTGDFNSDGKTDIFWYCPGEGADFVFLSNGDGTFATIPLFVDGDYQPLAGDYDGDGDTDVFFFKPGTGSDWLFSSNGDGTFTRIWQDMDEFNCRTAVGDYNGDGKADIFFYGLGSVADWLWTSNGDATFTVTSPVSIGENYRPLAGDFNGDGKADIFLYQQDGTVAAILLMSNGDGTFTAHSQTVGGNYQRILGDFNADGMADIFWYQAGTGADELWLSNGDGTFTSSPQTVDGNYRPLTGEFANSLPPM